MNEYAAEAEFARRINVLASHFSVVSPVVRPNRTALAELDAGFAVTRQGGLVRGLRRLGERLAHGFYRRRAIAELRGLDDRTLADIGVARHAIPGLVEESLRREAIAAGAPAPVAPVGDAWQAPRGLRQAGNTGRYDRAA